MQSLHVEQKVPKRNHQGVKENKAGTLPGMLSKKGAASGKAGSFTHASRDTRNSECSPMAFTWLGPSGSHGHAWYCRGTGGNVSGRAHGHSVMASILQTRLGRSWRQVRFFIPVYSTKHGSVRGSFPSKSRRESAHASWKSKAKEVGMWL